MERVEIAADSLVLRSTAVFSEKWMLLTAGVNEPGKYNMMTISWGSIGVMWGKPMVTVVVRPSRYTYEFMERHEDFTLSVFPDEYREQLTLCGTTSGRDTDKVSECGFSVVPSPCVTAPGFDEAELIIECRKACVNDLIPAGFCADHIEPNYNGTDYHRFFMGEILSVHGVAGYKGG